MVTGDVMVHPFPITQEGPSVKRRSLRGNRLILHPLLLYGRRKIRGKERDSNKRNNKTKGSGRHAKEREVGSGVQNS